MCSKGREILGPDTSVSNDQIEVILNALCSMAVEVSPWFRFRPFLIDPKDDHLIECALAANAKIILSGDKVFNHADVAAFGLTSMRAGDYVYATNVERKKGLCILFRWC